MEVSYSSFRVKTETDSLLLGRWEKWKSRGSCGISKRSGKVLPLDFSAERLFPPPFYPRIVLETQEKVLDSCDKRGPGRSHFGAALLGETTGGQLKADPIDFHDGGTLFGGKAGTPCLRVRICLEACAGIWIHINPCEECFESSGTHANCFWVAVRRALPRSRERRAR